MGLLGGVPVLFCFLVGLNFFVGFHVELIKIKQANGKQAVSARELYSLPFTLYNSALHIIRLSISNLCFKCVKGVYTSTLHLKCLPINKITFKSVKCKGVYTLGSYKIYREKIFF